MAKKLQRQVPTVEVECDLVLTDPETEEPWLDRSGQWVRYRSQIKYGVLKRLSRLSEDSAGNVDEVDQLLHHVVMAWDWDDDYGDPLPSPDTPGVFDDLESEEVTWLLSHVPGIGEAPK
jgi:hypothetical protein